MTQRYFVESRIAGSRAALVAAEAHHLAHVMRAKPGDQVVLFDGTGGEYLAEVERIDRSTVELAVLSHHAIEREIGTQLVVAAPLPKGDRQRWLIEKLVEIGVHSFVPIVTARAVAQPSEGALDRLRRAVIEASKQCGRNRLMQIHPPREWHDFIREEAADKGRLVAQPGAQRSLDDVLRDIAQRRPTGGVAMAVGPEGGLTEDEVQLATASGWCAVDLGPRILRLETAAIVLAVAAGMAVGTSDASW
jgi:16S rRNA (uracil1498-N3)-methyltransferase